MATSSWRLIQRLSHFAVRTPAGALPSAVESPRCGKSVPRALAVRGDPSPTRGPETVATERRRDPTDPGLATG